MTNKPETKTCSNMNLKTYLVPRFEYNPFFKTWDAWIEERTNDESNDTVFAWHVRECATPYEALEAVTSEYGRMCSNIIGHLQVSEEKQ